MRVRDILNDAFDLYQRFWKHLLSVAFIFYAVMSGVTAGLTAGVGRPGAAVGAFVVLVGSFWLTGALVEAVADIRDGRVDLSLGETLTRVLPRLLPLLVASILAAIGIAAGLVLLIVPGLLFWTWWAVITPAIVLEDKGIFESFGRSRELVRGHGWATFGVLLSTFVLVAITSGVIGGIFDSFLPDYGGHYIGNAVGGTITAPFQALAITLLYFRLAQPAPSAEPAALPR